jgi:hypothetical protein
VGQLKPCIVDQNVQLAQLRNGFFNDVRAVVLMPDIPRQQHATPSFGLDQFFGFLSVFFFPSHVRDGNIGAFAGKMDGYGSPDARVAPGDECYFILKFVRAFVEVPDYFRLRVQLGLNAGLGVLMLRGNFSFHNVAVGCTCLNKPKATAVVCRNLLKW